MSLYYMHQLYIIYISLLYIHVKIPINLYTKTSLHQSESALHRWRVVERFAEGHASVELQLLGAFCQSEVGKGWLVLRRRGGTWNMIFFPAKKMVVKVMVVVMMMMVMMRMIMIIQVDGWVTPKILGDGLGVFPHTSMDRWPTEMKLARTGLFILIAFFWKDTFFSEEGGDFWCEAHVTFCKLVNH